MARNSASEFHFYGDLRDPLRTGIEVIPAAVRAAVAFHPCRTVHWSRRLAFQWCALREAIAGDYDTYILEGNPAIVTNWPAIALARTRRKRVLLYTHGWLREDSGLKDSIRDRFYRLADGLLLYGRRAKAIGIARGFDPRRLHVVYNSLDDERLIRTPLAESHEARAAVRSAWFGKQATRPTVVSVGRLTARKRYPLLLHAAKLLADEGLPINVLLVGDGPERPALESLALDLKVTLVCAGSRYDEEFLSQCFRAADMTVIPGAAGLTVIHSLSYGTPVVVHDDANQQVPEAEAVVDGVNGGVFREGNARDLADAITRTLRALPNTQPVADQCRAIVDAAYHPSQMRRIVDNAVAGLMAV